MNDIRKYFNIPIDNKESFSIVSNTSTSTSTNTKNSTSCINIFTDGSSLNNGQKNKYQAGGMGIYIEDTKEEISQKLEGKITNNIAELKACIIGINNVINRKNYKNNLINIYSDSEYVINSITKWASNWKKNDWKKYNKSKKCKCDIKNKDLIIELYNLYNKYSINFSHVKAHKIKPANNQSKEYKIWYGNYMADKLAVIASNSK